MDTHLKSRTLCKSNDTWHSNNKKSFNNISIKWIKMFHGKRVSEKIRKVVILCNVYGGVESWGWQEVAGLCRLRSTMVCNQQIATQFCEVRCNVYQKLQSLMHDYSIEYDTFLKVNSPCNFGI